MNIKQIDVGGITVDVVFKEIKNVHLSVHPPTGRVRISAPARMNLDTIRVYAISKINWIKKHQKRFHEQERETRREYLDRESHYVWGKRYLLKDERRLTRPCRRGYFRLRNRRWVDGNAELTAPLHRSKIGRGLCRRRRLFRLLGKETRPVQPYDYRTRLESETSRLAQNLEVSVAHHRRFPGPTMPGDEKRPTRDFAAAVPRHFLDE